MMQSTMGGTAGDGTAQSENGVGLMGGSAAANGGSLFDNNEHNAERSGVGVVGGGGGAAGRASSLLTSLTGEDPPKGADVGGADALGSTLPSTIGVPNGTNSTPLPESFLVPTTEPPVPPPLPPQQQPQSPAPASAPPPPPPPPAPAAAAADPSSAGVVASRADLFGTALTHHEPSSSSDFPSEEEEADLFGKIEPPSSASAGGPSSAAGRALLEGSGLMGGSGGGLFDEVDAAEERERLRREEEERSRKAREEEERRRREEEEANLRRAREVARQEAERAAAEAAEAAAQARAAEERMHDLSLSSPGPPPPQHGGKGYVAQQQGGQYGQQQQPQQGGQPAGNFYRPEPAAPPPPPPPQQQQQQQLQQPPVNAGYGGGSYYYTSNPPPPSQGNAGNNNNTTYGAHGMHGRYQSAVAPAAVPSSGASVASSVTNPSVMAGLHNGHDVSVGGAPPASHRRPAANRFAASRAAPPPPGPDPATAAFRPLYGPISVGDPLLLQSPGLFGGPPHWSYQVATPVLGQNGQAAEVGIRRRFRHFVALEDRLREACPGAVLPPRPDKHPTRAIEEATTHQSAQFAAQRASELQIYLNNLASHPIAGKSDVLRLFLTLQDHIGTAWPEVSSNAITRLGAVGAGAAVKVAEGTNDIAMKLGSSAQEVGEDNAELLSLASSEGLRIGAVTQAVPKIEGTIAMVRELGERGGFVGMEMSKLAKDLMDQDRELSVPFEIMGNSLLRDSRRTKRLAVEMAAAAAPFLAQHRLCKYEKMAFADRRAALAKRQSARAKADSRAQKLMVHQSSLQSMGKVGLLEKMEMEAAMSDEMAVEAQRECDGVGGTLKAEVGRVAHLRRKEWSSSMKVLASCMRESCGERAAIWEGAREAFKAEFPGIVLPPGNGGGGEPAPMPAWYASYREGVLRRYHRSSDGWDRVSF